MAPPALVVGTNTFCSLAEALAFHEASAFGGGWLATTVTDDQRTLALLSATRRMVSELAWAGRPALTTQDLPFPRTGLYTRSGAVLSSSSIPDEICWAESQWALTILEAAEAGETDISAREEAIEQIKAGSVELTFAGSAETAAEDASGPAVPDNVLRLIPSDWLLHTPTAREVRSVPLISG